MTLFVVSIVIFTAVNLLPGDFAQSILGQGATKDAVEAIRKDLGLDQPFFVRYLDWLSGAVRGDLGTSFAAANSSSFVGSDIGQVFCNAEWRILQKNSYYFEVGALIQYLYLLGD